jgi:hypothetical protein
MASVLYKVNVVGGQKDRIIQDTNTGTTSTFTLVDKPNVYSIGISNLTAARAMSSGYVQSTGVVTISGLTSSDSIFYVVRTD